MQYKIQYKTTQITVCLAVCMIDVHSPSIPEYFFQPLNEGFLHIGVWSNLNVSSHFMHSN